MPAGVSEVVLLHLQKNQCCAPRLEAKGLSGEGKANRLPEISGVTGHLNTTAICRSKLLGKLRQTRCDCLALKFKGCLHALQKLGHHDGLSKLFRCNTAVRRSVLGR